VRTFAIGDLVLRVTAGGTTGAHALMCAMGLDRIPVTIDACFGRGEWGDIIAKARGMCHAESLYRYPIVRQFCGCRVCADPLANDAIVVGLLVVRLCPKHLWHPIPGMPAQKYEDEGLLVLGQLTARA